ncbi:MAG: hypothetical protein F4X94_01455, partial [Dehalococcoidia bacterium]|nr:hypothetical protein [Dehalococcoidia bacterium]
MKKASEVRVQWHPEHFSGWMVEARHLISDWLAHLASIGVDDVAIVGFANAHANFALHSYTIEANGVEYCCCYASGGSFFG